MSTPAVTPHDPASSRTPAGALDYVIVDPSTGSIDWDIRLHLNHEEAVAALTGPGQRYVADFNDEVPGLTMHWSRRFLIRPVLDLDASRNPARTPRASAHMEDPDRSSTGALWPPLFLPRPPSPPPQGLSQRR